MTRLSTYFLPTLREDPADAESVSHRLMTRAGLIRQLGAGLYTWLPAGYRVIKRVEAIVREGMAKAGPVMVEVDMLSVGAFASNFAGPPVKKEEPSERQYA